MNSKFSEKMKPRTKKGRVTSETVKPQGAGTCHCSSSTSKDTEKQDPDSRDGDKNIWYPTLQPLDNFPESCFEIIDLTSAVCDNSPQIEHEHISHETSKAIPELDGSEDDTVEWDPEEDLGGADDDETDVITWYYNSEGTKSPELTGGLPQDVHLPLSSTIGQTLLHTQSINEEGMETIQDSEPQGKI
ncbi:hypothetical protein Q5P01_000406 [Channa striata]|uniref:Uncharacterized protein n=1 Tax=Channa striata TaxID=64152 RepID=A0AA88IVK7_CHASR|nr:hypothetical protein Q5P01_000406 [Channa striata]